MVLVGPNGAGKTNFVQGMQLFGQILERGTTDPARGDGWGQIVRRAQKPARGGVSFRAKCVVPAGYMHSVPREGQSETGPVTVEIGLSLKGSVDTGDVTVASESITISRKDGGVVQITSSRKGIDVDPGDDRLLWDTVADSFSGSLRRRLREISSSSIVLAAGAKDKITELFREEFRVEEEFEGRLLRILSVQRYYSRWLRYIIRSCAVTRMRLDATSLRDDSSFRDADGEVFVRPSGRGLAAAIDGLRSVAKGEAFQMILGALRAVYPRIEDVVPSRVLGGRLTLLFKEIGINEMLDISSVSDGVLHALALLVMIYGQPGAGILAIEEPENAIHPWSIRSIMLHAQEDVKRQILITTHSETVVNAVKDPASLMIVEHVGDAGTHIVSAASRETAIDSILRGSGQKLGDLWMDGSLGGVPGPANG